ncbi:MAG: protein phosphatase 2C domain-containing protein, partial [Oscillospiraceae bacterium]|nr:protein phosphatase 2C domain-containing protein [Oscillospiraceae bacterium]
MYEGFCHSVIGASHVAKGTVCQDFSNFQSNESYSIAVVADGHGSKKHFRSDVGSRLAVRATLRTV